MKTLITKIQSITLTQNQKTALFFTAITIVIIAIRIATQPLHR